MQKLSWLEAWNQAELRTSFHFLIEYNVSDMLNIVSELEASEGVYGLAEECCRKKCSIQRLRSLCCTIWIQNFRILFYGSSFPKHCCLFIPETNPNLFTSHLNIISNYAHTKKSSSNGCDHFSEKNQQCNLFIKQNIKLHFKDCYIFQINNNYDVLIAKIIVIFTKHRLKEIKYKV